MTKKRSDNPLGTIAPYVLVAGFLALGFLLNPPVTGLSLAEGLKNTCSNLVDSETKAECTLPSIKVTGVSKLIKDSTEREEDAQKDCVRKAFAEAKLKACLNGQKAVLCRAEIKEKSCINPAFLSDTEVCECKVEIKCTGKTTADDYEKTDCAKAVDDGASEGCTKEIEEHEFGGGTSEDEATASAKAKCLDPNTLRHKEDRFFDSSTCFGKFGKQTFCKFEFAEEPSCSVVGREFKPLEPVHTVVKCDCKVRFACTDP